jgi:hypothetical protein
MLIESDFIIKSELQPELLAGEKLLWTGKPKKGVVFRPVDIFLIPFSLIWCSGVLPGIKGAVFGKDRPELFELLFFVPFIIAGLYSTVGRFALDSWRRANTVYGLTERRVIIRSGLFSKSIQSININSITDMSIKEKTDRSGTITFGPTDFRTAMVDNMGWGFEKGSPKLELIDNVRQVYNQLLQLQHN